MWRCGECIDVIGLRMFDVRMCDVRTCDVRMCDVRMCDVYVCCCCVYNHIYNMRYEIYRYMDIWLDFIRGDK